MLIVKLFYIRFSSLYTIIPSEDSSDEVLTSTNIILLAFFLLTILKILEYLKLYCTNNCHFMEYFIIYRNSRYVFLQSTEGIYNTNNDILYLCRNVMWSNSIFVKLIIIVALPCITWVVSTYNVYTEWQNDNISRTFENMLLLALIPRRQTRILSSYTRFFKQRLVHFNYKNVIILDVNLTIRNDTDGLTSSARTWWIRVQTFQSQNRTKRPSSIVPYNVNSYVTKV